MFNTCTRRVLLTYNNPVLGRDLYMQERIFWETLYVTYKPNYDHKSCVSYCILKLKLKVVIRGQCTGHVNSKVINKRWYLVNGTRDTQLVWTLIGSHNCDLWNSAVINDLEWLWGHFIYSVNLSFLKSYTSWMRFLPMNRKLHVDHRTSIRDFTL